MATGGSHVSMEFEDDLEVGARPFATITILYIGQYMLAVPLVNQFPDAIWHC